MAPPRIPPIQCLLACEAVARLRSVSTAADELSVAPSAVSRRSRQLEPQLGLKLFQRGFALTADGSDHIDPVRQGLRALQQVPGRGGQATVSAVVRLRLAVTATFSRQVLLPR
jgi:LysR family transcriptional regulator, glycine cleavage system transcriptional activator